MELKDISFSYNNSNDYLIDKLNLKIEKGMFLSVLGENGSAKSTLIRLMLGLLKANKGTINNEFKKIGYVPQKKEKFNSNFPITVGEILKIHSNTTKDSKKEVMEVLKIVSLENEINSLFGDLSGGQMQRVLIARAILGNPDLLILDEPLTGIDKLSQEVLRELLNKLNKEGLTIVSIEHDIAYALHNSSHILVMKHGKETLYTANEFMKKINHEDLDNYLYHMEVH